MRRRTYVAGAIATVVAAAGVLTAVVVTNEDETREPHYRGYVEKAGGEEEEEERGQRAHVHRRELLALEARAGAPAPDRADEDSHEQAEVEGTAEAPYADLRHTIPGAVRCTTDAHTRGCYRITA